jgi:hypothetical protein
MNEALAEPVYRAVSQQWERVFVGGLKADLEKLNAAAVASLRGFHDGLAAALAAAGVRAERVAPLRRAQEAAGAASVAAAVDKARARAAAAQKEASRQVTPAVQEQMKPGYAAGLAEAGPGSHARRTGVVERHVDACRGQMFSDAIEPVLASLDGLRKELCALLAEALAALAPTLRLQYGALWEAPERGAAEARTRLLRPCEAIALEARGARARLLAAMRELGAGGDDADAAGGSGAGAGGDEEEIVDVTAAVAATRAAQLEAQRVDLTAADSDDDDGAIMPRSRAAAAAPPPAAPRVKREQD